MKHTLISPLVALTVMATLFTGCAGKSHQQLFNGKDLSGWKAVLREAEEGMEPTFTADKGILHISG